MSSIIIATEFTRSTHTPALIEQAKATGATVILVHTATGRSSVPGCVNLLDTRRRYAAWINTGLDAAPNGPRLVLNDDLVMSAAAMRQMLDLGHSHDLVSLPKTGGVTPISGWCLTLGEQQRFDEGYGWWYSDDDLWHTLVAVSGRIAITPVNAQHRRPSRVHYPAEFTDVVRADRQRFAERWRNGSLNGLPA